MAGIQGLRTTGNFVADQRPKNWREGILMLNPNGTAPLFALTSQMKTETTDDPQFYWWQKKKQSRRLTLGAAVADGAATTFTLTGNGLELRPNDYLFIEQTREIVKVTAIASNTSITVVRGAQGSTAAAVPIATSGVNPNVFLIGSAFEEGSSAPDGRNYDATKLTNYTQIFRNTLEMTRTANKTRLRTGSAIAEAKREALELHQHDIEMAFWFGKAFETTQNGRPVRTTGGIDSWITSNRVAVAGGGLTMSAFEGYMEQAFAYGSNQKMLFTGNRGLTALNQMARKNSSYQIFAGEKEYGMNISRFVCPHGELVVKTHPLWNAIPGGVNTTAYNGLDSQGYILDMANLKYRPFAGDDTRYEKQLGANDLDGEKSGYITEAGLELHFEETHMFISNLNLGVADA